VGGANMCVCDKLTQRYGNEKSEHIHENILTVKFPSSFHSVAGYVRLPNT
jgi:hypothetical protein